MSTATPPDGQPDYPQRNPKAEAKAAKAYYKASRPWFKKKRFIIPLAFVALIVVGTAIGGGGDEDPTTGNDTAADAPASPNDDPTASAEPTPTKKSTPTPKPEPKALNVKAAAMLDEFDANEAAADAKYKGKTVRVTGVVDKVDTDFFDDSQYVIRIAGGGEFEFLTVNCNGITGSVAAKVNKGDTLTVLGDFDDGGDLGVELKDCAIA